MRQKEYWQEAGFLEKTYPVLMGDVFFTFQHYLTLLCIIQSCLLSKPLTIYLGPQIKIIIIAAMDCKIVR